MKKILKYFSIILLAAGLFSCSDIATNDNDEKTDIVVSKGQTTVKMFVPDYYAMSQTTARVVAPQTTSVKFGYKDGEDFVYIDAIKLSKAEKNAIEGAEGAGLSGNTYTLTFSGIPTGTYSKGELKVQLRDSQENVISEGTNSNSVTVSTTASAEATFYTIPTAIDAAESSLSENEMKFLKVELNANTSYEVKVEIGESDDSYPDLVIFNSDGTFSKYVSIESAEANKYTFDVVTKSKSYYIGVYSDKAVASYKLTFGEVVISELNEDFEGELNSILEGSGKSYGIGEDEPLKAWVQYGNALVDTHSKVYKLATYTTTPGTSILKISKLSPSEESALSFDFKTDFMDGDTFKVFVDGKEQEIYVDGESLGTSVGGAGAIWRRGSVILSEGTHNIEFQAVKKGNSYSLTYTNAVYLDNLSLAANKTASVDISPKGLQETYVGGFSIPFTAKALRSDGSVIAGKTATWEGATDGTFAPSSEGTFTVTATIDGKSASNSVKVHSENYLSDSITLAGREFTGEITNGSGARKNTTNITWEDPTPICSTFSTDGFFVLKGSANNVNGYVKITKDDYVTYYFLPKGDFEQRIWLRFGAGEYTVLISEMDFSYYSVSGDYQGDISGYGSYYTSGPTTYTMTVTNTNTSLTAEEACYLLPSSWCQCDDFRITNAVNAVLAELPEDATDGQKLAALHDWEVHRMYYDYDSLGGARKAQDALHVLEYEMGVCEGYSNLFTALERVAGIKGTVICASYNSHAWNNTYYNGEWFLLDATWDDPLMSGDSKTDKKSLREYYKYFLLTAEEDSATGEGHNMYAIMPDLVADMVGGNGINNMRAITSNDGKKAPYVRGLPNGWY